MRDFEKALVRVEQGWLQGYTEGRLKIFKGVPYAAPPVGALRFRRPQVPACWRGVRRATQYSAAAVQHVMDLPDLPANTHGVPQAMAPSQYEEDCLYLNIWTPAKTPDARLPVFLWVHGGGMVAGSGCEVVCDGTGFAGRKDVVVVTINYRLNIFGFFGHPELTAEAGSSGNYGLWDMRQACQWVRDNIAQFGGDPERITVAGQSGGAAGTGALHASPMMQGLIKRVSIESGPIYWGFMQPQPMKDLEQKGVEFMRLAGCETLEELRQKDAWELYDLYERFAPRHGGMPHAFGFCVDGVFLPKPYEEMIDSGEFNDFDVMIGSCAQEFPCVDVDSFTVEDYRQWLREEFPESYETMLRWYPAENRAQASKQVSTIASDVMLMGSVRLAQKCHAMGMSVCLDFVMNHTSEDHEWAKRARMGEKEYQDRYFFYDNWDIPNEFEKTVPQVFPTTAPGNFTWCEEAKKVVMTTFYPYQWDLNYANPVVFNLMSADMLYLCNQGIDVIRLDATPYIWKTLGTSCRNLPEVHTLVRMMHLACDIVCPGTLLLGEVVMEPSKVVPYFGSVQKPECHMLYNVTTMASTWHTVATHDVRLLRHQLETVFRLPKQYTFLNYLRCHDDIGWGLDYPFLRQFGMQEAEHKQFLNDWFRGAYNSDARGELYNDDPRLRDARLCGTTASLCGIEAAGYEQDAAKLKKSLRLDEMLHAFLLVQSGIPVLYSGDEVAQENDYRYHDDPLKREDSRYLHRGSMDWTAAENRKDLTTKEGKIFHAIGRLVRLRRDNRVFHADADTWTLDTYNDHVLGIGRYYQGQKLLAFFNFSELGQIAWVNEQEEYTDLLTGKDRPARGVSLPGYGFAWLVTDFTENNS